MKPKSFIAVATAFLSPAVSILHAGERLNLESAIYVFRQSAFHEIDVSNAVVAADRQTFVLKSPATAKFDQLTLSLEDSRVAWGSGSSAPEQFSMVAFPPTVPIALNAPVTMNSSASVQYLERTADNGLQVREIRSDSPEAPHVRLSFTASKGGDSAEDLLLVCDLDIATVYARQKVPGVALEVGKPNIISFKETETLHVRSGQRAAILLKAPNGSDYSMLLFLRLAYAEEQNAVPSNGGEPSQNAGAHAGATTSETPVVPVVEIDEKQYVIVGFTEHFSQVGRDSGYLIGQARDPIALVDGKTVVGRENKVSIIPGKAFGKGFVTVVANVFRAYEYHPDMIITTDNGFNFGPHGSDLTEHFGYTSLSGTLTADRDMPDVTLVLLFYEDLDKNDVNVPRGWIMGTSIGRLEAGKTHAFNESFPRVTYSKNPISWTTLVFSGGWQIPSTGGNQVVNELLDRIKRAKKINADPVR
jgi:hypothetical protein